MHIVHASYVATNTHVMYDSHACIHAPPHFKQASYMLGMHVYFGNLSKNYLGNTCTYLCTVNPFISSSSSSSSIVMIDNISYC